jgi:hypothetical protein
MMFGRLNILSKNAVNYRSVRGKEIMKRKTLTRLGLAVLGGLVVALGAEAQGPQAGNEPVASLTQVQGTVMVNYGKDYVAARSGAPLPPGTRVLTMDKSSASVAYKDSCVKQLKENGMLVVRGPADCQASGAVKTVGPYYAAAIGSDIRADASSERSCAVRDADGKDRCCACCEKDGEERDKCCEKEKKDGIKGGCCDKADKDDRDRCCKTCVVAFWPPAGHLAAGAVIFGGGAAIIYNSSRVDRAVSGQ